MKNTNFIAEPGKQEILFSRVFDAPQSLVFKAYTDPKFVSQWWGPRSYTTIVDKMDPRQGGSWRYINRDAKGQEYAFHGVYHTVKAPDMIVDTFEFEGMPGHVSLETVTLEDQGGTTKVTGKTVFQSVADRDGMLATGMEQGLSESMDRLADVLEKSKVAAGK
jgi:uncharacterized protein YndB with AHSA1/START domain